MLQAGFNRQEAVLLSLLADLQALGVALFGVSDRQLRRSLGLAARRAGAVSLACLAVLRARVRAVEIVT